VRAAASCVLVRVRLGGVKHLSVHPEFGIGLKLVSRPCGRAEEEGATEGGDASWCDEGRGRLSPCLLPSTIPASALASAHVGRIFFCANLERATKLPDAGVQAGRTAWSVRRRSQLRRLSSTCSSSRFFSCAQHRPQSSSRTTPRRARPWDWHTIETRPMLAVP
jgi:hypothetical protein